MVERFGITFERVLRRRVEPHEGGGKEAEHAADEEEAAAPLRAHGGQHGARHAHRAEEVHVEEIAGLHSVRLFDGADDGRARVVDEDVDSPGLCQDRRDAALDRGLVAHVEHDLRDSRDRRGAGGPDGPEHAEASPRQLGRGGLPDSRRDPGDQCDSRLTHNPSPI